MDINSQQQQQGQIKIALITSAISFSVLFFSTLLIMQSVYGVMTPESREYLKQFGLDMSNVTIGEDGTVQGWTLDHSNAKSAADAPPFKSAAGAEPISENLTGAIILFYK